MAPHSSTLAWKIPRMEKSGGLQSMGSLRVGHDWATSLSLFTFMHWRRKWQPTPVFLLGESQGRRSLVGCHLWGRTESDTTEWLSSSSSNPIYRLPWWLSGEEPACRYISKFGKLSSGHRTGKGQFHSNPKERQCQRMLKPPHNCTHLTR